MLEAQQIVKNYGQLSVLKGIDLKIEGSEVVSIVGASGAGKSTLLQILGTLDKPDSGRVLIDKADVSAMNGNELAKFRNQKIGFIFQFHNLLPEFTALENICMPGYIGRRNQEEVATRALELMDMLQIKHRQSHRPSELSGGEQQRTAVARALINNPAIIFADEPSGNLDSKNAEQLHQLFFDLRNELGQTFIIVTHNNKFAQMANRVLEIKDGDILSNQTA